MITDHSAFSKTRAEEYDSDVWGKFFIPPYYSALNIKKSTKSMYFVGKRGCGKTMLLKYLDYHSQFSRNRNEIPEDEIEHVGIYLRMDTHFCNSMKYRGKDDTFWINLFDQYMGIIISLEIINSLSVISSSNFSLLNKENIKKIDLSFLAGYETNFPENLLDLKKLLIVKRNSINNYISNIEILDQQETFLGGKKFVDSLIEALKFNDFLENINFYLYLDEVENVTDYQRIYLNTLLKHSKRPFIVNFTSKVISDSNATMGSEYINATHDYDLYNLDKVMSAKEEKTFFAEVYLGNTELSNRIKDSKIIKDITNESKIEYRKSDTYQSEILEIVRAKFPSLTLSEVAKNAIHNERIKNILLEQLTKAFKNKSINYDANKFFNDYKDMPSILIISPALLNRRNYDLVKVNNLFEGYQNNVTVLKKQVDDLIHNNLFSAILELYRPYKLGCPLYSGFETFFTMSNNNLRHFLILCLKTIEISDLFYENAEFFNIETQVKASYSASESLIKETRTFGKLGESLRIFTLRLGTLFQTLQSSPTLSEPEQNQFTINSGHDILSSEDNLFISEALKNHILIENIETKTKAVNKLDLIDYQLNPIYAPYFNISYRRKRKIEISVKDFKILYQGSEDEVSELVKKLIKAENTPTSQLNLL